MFAIVLCTPYVCWCRHLQWYHVCVCVTTTTIQMQTLHHHKDLPVLPSPALCHSLALKPAPLICTTISIAQPPQGFLMHELITYTVCKILDISFLTSIQSPLSTASYCCKIHCLASHLLGKIWRTKPRKHKSVRVRIIKRILPWTRSTPGLDLVSCRGKSGGYFFQSEVARLSLGIYL